MIVTLPTVVNGTIDIDLDCPTCGNPMGEKEIKVPDPNFMAEKAQDSYSEEEKSLVCGICDEETYAFINNGFSDCFVDFPGVNDDTRVKVSINYSESDYFGDVLDPTKYVLNPFEIFSNEMASIKQIVSYVPEASQISEPVYKQCFSSTVTLLETYLLDAIRIKVLEHEFYLKQLVRQFKAFSEVKFSLSDYFDVDIKREVQIKLSELMYHNIGKINGLYKCAFGIEFSNIGPIAKIVLQRHDLVHRNGKTKTGEPVNIDKSAVDDAIKNVTIFVEDVEGKINSLKTFFTDPF